MLLMWLVATPGPNNNLNHKVPIDRITFSRQHNEEMFSTDISEKLVCTQLVREKANLVREIAGCDQGKSRVWLRGEASLVREIAGCG